MFRLFRRIILGGKSDKREGAWLIFFVVNAILFFAVWKESAGVSMTQTWAFLVIAWPATVTAVIGVHVQHFHAQAQAGRARAELEDEFDDRIDL